MNDPDHERLREIEESARKVDELAYALDVQKRATKTAREEWEAAVERHLELCRATEDSQDVAEAPLLRRIEERGAEANGQPVVADAVTEPANWTEDEIAEYDAMHATHPVVGALDADHEEDDPEWHGEPVVSDLSGHRIADWHEQDAKAEADALAAIESGAKRAKGRKRSKAQQG